MIVDSFKLDVSTQYITVGSNSFFAYSIVDNIKQKNYSLFWYCYLHKDKHFSNQSLREYSNQIILSEVTHLHHNWHQPISNLISNSQKIVKMLLLSYLVYEHRKFLKFLSQYNNY